MNVNDDLIADFLIECHENLDQLDRDLVALEKAPQNRENLASIFRTVHTIKGNCGLLQFSPSANGHPCRRDAPQPFAGRASFS